jgi:hypothetical protein
MRNEVGISSILHLPSSVLVQAPLSELILSGRLKEYDSWQVVRGEQGLVVVPLTRSPG